MAISTGSVSGLDDIRDLKKKKPKKRPHHSTKKPKRRGHNTKKPKGHRSTKKPKRHHKKNKKKGPKSTKKKGTKKGRTTILITEIVDLYIDSLKVPRYVELYAPRMRDRGENLDVGLKLVIFHSDSEEPHWPSAVLVVCNWAAYEAYGDECGIASFDLAGPMNSNGNDQIALISGDESGWSVVDIYGVIGEDGWGKDI